MSTNFYATTAISKYTLLAKTSPKINIFSFLQFNYKHDRMHVTRSFSFVEAFNEDIIVEMVDVH